MLVTWWPAGGSTHRRAALLRERGPQRSERRRPPRGRPPRSLGRRPSSCRSTRRRCAPRAPPERGARVHRAGLAWGRCSRRRRAAPDRRGARPRPSAPGSAQEVDEPGVVNGEERVVSVRLGVDDRCAGILELGTDAIGPRGSSSASIATPIQTAVVGACSRCASLHVTGTESDTRYPAKRYSAATSGVRYAADGLPAGVKTPMTVSSRSALAFSTMCTCRGRSRNVEPGPSPSVSSRDDGAGPALPAPRRSRRTGGSARAPSRAG